MTTTPCSLIEQAAVACAGARKGVALTGAGISVESGIPPFRGKGGLWEKIDPMKYAHVTAFENHPAEVWEVLFIGMSDVLEKASPNAAHKGLQQLEDFGFLQAVITQNVDGLHQQAGNSDVIEFHGTHAFLRCSACSRRLDAKAVPLDHLPPKCRCGGVLRPDVVLFGEMIDPNLLQRSQLLSAGCDVMLVIGTSGTVEPAASLPLIAKHSGAFIIEINPEPTPLTDRISDVTLLGPAGEIMDELVDRVKKLKV